MALAKATGKGVVMSRPDYILLDTREMEWEDFQGIDGCKVKVLTRDEQGEPMICLIWFPAAPHGWTGDDLPHRHYHKSVIEWAFCLSGGLPGWEYENAEQKKGDPVEMREGYFMYRLPGSIHGQEPGPHSATGALMLIGRNGTGNNMNEPNFQAETVTVPYE
jgi:hypothetical protein